MGLSASKFVQVRDSEPDDDTSTDSSKACSLLFASAEDLEETYGVPKFTQEILSAGLGSVAEALRKQGTYIRIVTVGGAVNTLLLRTRRATSDVDFFYHTHNDDVDVQNLIRVAEGVARTSDQIDDEQWLNNHTSSFIEGSVLKRLYRQSIRQNRLVFDSTSLKVYAAAWPFAFVQKVIRYGSEQRKAYDIDDAVAYLKEIEEGATISYEAVVAWANEYKLPQPKRAAFEAIVEKYSEEVSLTWARETSV